MRVEQRSQLAAMQQMESRSDEELEAETKFKAAAQAILGARAAERYDAKAARAHFQRAIAAARPQERLQLRRMADASLALAERRADDLKRATERLGRRGADQPPAARAEVHGPGGAAQERRHPGPRPRHAHHHRPGRRRSCCWASASSAWWRWPPAACRWICGSSGASSSSWWRSACSPSSGGADNARPRPSAPSRSRRAAAEPDGAAAVCGRYSLATPDPGGDAGPLSDRRVDRGEDPLQRRPRRRGAGGDHRPRGARRAATCCAGAWCRRGPRAPTPV